MAFRCCTPVRKEGWDGRVGDSLTARERQVVDAFLDAVQVLSNRVDSQLVRDLLSRGVDPVMSALGMGGFVAELQPMVDALAAEVGAGGVAALDALPKRVVGEMRFDVKDPRAIAWAENRAGELIREVTENQRLILRDVLGQAVRDGWTTDEAAAALKQQVGLHQRWASAVGNARGVELERLLKTGMDASRAALKADEFAARYHDRLLRSRAKNIARTEIMTAANQGRYLSWAQGVEGGYIAPDTKKRWLTGPLGGSLKGKKVCDVCAPLREEVVAWDKPFSNGVMMPPAHPSCRCTAVLVPLSIEEVRQRLADDNTRSALETPTAPADSAIATTSDAVEWIRRKHPNLQIDIPADWPAETVIPSLRQLDKLATEYPDVANGLTVRAHLGDPPDGLDQANAWFDPRDRTISLGRVYQDPDGMRALDAARAVRFDDDARRWYSRRGSYMGDDGPFVSHVSGTAEGILTHEFGHAVEDHYRRTIARLLEDVSDPKMVRTVGDIDWLDPAAPRGSLQQLVWDLEKDIRSTSRSLSLYAQFNFQEGFAEAFSAMYLPGGASLPSTASLRRWADLVSGRVPLSEALGVESDVAELLSRAAASGQSIADYLRAQDAAANAVYRLLGLLE